jgi:hypothetical protein
VFPVLLFLDSSTAVLVDYRLKVDIRKCYISRGDCAVRLCNVMTAPVVLTGHGRQQGELVETDDGRSVLLPAEAANPGAAIV